MSHPHSPATSSTTISAATPPSQFAAEPSLFDYKVGEYKCLACGWVHVAIKREFAVAQNYDLERLSKCFRCGAPSALFLPAEQDDAPTGCTLQAIVLPESGRGSYVAPGAEQAGHAQS